MEKEIWKDIPGYEGVYQVSNLGRVKRLNSYRVSSHGSKSFVSERILKPTPDKDGYPSVALGKYGGTKKIHRLVASVFIPNPQGLPQVNHKNEIKSDNRAKNLEWCTSQYNNTYGSHSIRAGIAHRKPIIMLTKDGDFIRRFEYIKEAEEFLCIKGASTMIIRSCNNNNRTAYGFKWRYEK